MSRTSSLTPHQRALRLQKRIFRSLKTEAGILLGDMPKSIQKYEKENLTDFRGKKLNTDSSNLTKEELISSVQNADVTFIADFHTFDQAQKTALRIMEEATHKNSEWMIGLELISSDFQEQLDAFQKGELSLEEFHETVDYRVQWGFPWENYAPIFQWAKEKKIRLIALNQSRNSAEAEENGEESELHKRDQWAAEIITRHFMPLNPRQKEKSQIQMIVLYGELHVGTRHLPKQLTRISKEKFKTPLSWITIHQNEDSLFWKLADLDRERDTEAVKLGKNVYCVFSSTPWAKLQSLISWVEGEEHDAMEPEDDYLSSIRTYGNTIAEFLGETPPSYEAISVSTMNQADILESLSKSNLLSKSELRLVDFHITYNQRLYIPRVGVVYLGSPSHNGAAELAAIHLLRTRNKSEELFLPRQDDFFRVILEAAFGFFGSLILNHRRKCDLPKDHLRRLRDLENNGKTAFPYEKEARLIALNVFKNRSSDELDLKAVLERKKLAAAAMMGARYVGYILGTQLHQAVLSEELKLDFIPELFLESSDSSSDFFESRYQELIHHLAEIQGAEIPATQSKLEHW